MPTIRIKIRIIKTVAIILMVGILGFTAFHILNMEKRINNLEAQVNLQYKK